MKAVLVGAGALLAAVVLVAVVAVLAATARWDRATEEFRQRLAEGAALPTAAPPADTTSLPPPVRRWMERSVPAGAAPIRLATLRQEGTFQMGEGEEGWRPFTAVQHVRASPPGFLWDATIHMAAGVPVRVRDGYDGGVGTMKGAVWALAVMVEGQPTRELAEGSLYRYLAEAAWIPSRLLPGDGLTWTPVDDDTALATLVDGGLSVSVRFHFDAAGDITGISVPARARVVDGESRTMPWVGRFSGHGPVDGGYRIPAEGEVAWVVDGVEVPYWRGRLPEVRFTF